MKMNKLFLAFACILLFASAMQFSSAHRSSWRYNDLDTNDDVIFIIRDSGYYDGYSSDVWENEDRFPVYDYRNGYSYRAERAYQEELNEQIYRNTYYEHYDDYYYSYGSRPYTYDSGAEYYYEYDDYMRTYTKHKCYPNPPRGQLFYIKCP